MIQFIKNLIKRIIYRKYYKMCPGFVGEGCSIVIRNCKFDQYVSVAHHAQISDSYIGNHTSIGRYDKIREADIGKYCSLSWDCTIGAPTHPYKTVTTCALTYRKEYGVVDHDSYFLQKRTIIGNDVWIGCDVTLISGVHIGDGAIIGAGAVVTKDVPPYEIWGGVPAKRIGSRFDKETIDILEEIQWWNWSTEELVSCIDLFSKDLDVNIAKELKSRHIGTKTGDM